MKKYTVTFIRDGQALAAGHGQARSWYEAYTKADATLGFMYQGITYDGFKVEEEREDGRVLVHEEK